MKLKSYFAFLSLIILTLVFINIESESVTHSAYGFTAGSPGAKTNSPTDGSTCNSCHSGAINTGNGMPSITAPGLSNGYIPGQTYTITANIVDASINKFGFEVTVERDADNSKIGTLIVTDGARTKFVNGGNAITHKSGGTGGSGSASWSFDWTAPPAGTGDVTFFGAFNSANGNGSTSGDNIYTTSFQVNESITTSINENKFANNFSTYPNPTSGIVFFNSTEKINSLSVFNQQGKLILTKKDGQSIDLTEHPNGIYFVVATIHNKTFTRKIVKS